MNRRLLTILAFGAVGGIAGAALKSRLVRSNDAAATSFPVIADASSPSAEPAPPGAQPQPRPPAPRPPRPSLAELQAAPPDGRMRLLVRWLADATAGEIAALAEEWYGASPGSGTAEWRAMAARWVELDPAAALAFGRRGADRLLFLHRSSGDASMETPLSAVYRSWGKIDPDAALASLALEDPRYRLLATGFLKAAVGEERACAWAIAHPELPEFAEWREEPAAADSESIAEAEATDPAKVAASFDPASHHLEARNIASNWAKTDPDAALEWARSLTDPRHRESALDGIIGALLSTDPAEARPLLDELPPGFGRAMHEARYAAALAKDDPDAALRFAQESLRGTARLEAIANIAAIQGKSDPLAALRLLQKHGIGDMDSAALGKTHIDGPSRGSMSLGSNHLDPVFKAAAPLDPAGVMQLLAETGSIHPPGDQPMFQRGELARTLFAEWAARDKPAAAEWLAQQPSTPGTTALLKHMTDRWPSGDLDGLRQLATRFPAGESRDEIVGEAARRLAANDPESALAWAAQTGGDPAVTAAFRHIAETRPQDAVAHFNDFLTPEQRAGQSQHLTDQLARRSPADAIGFYESLPPDQQVAVKLYDTTKAFARLDPEAASEWILSLPATQAKDTAISGLVDYLIRDAAEPDPLAAAHWAAASLDPDGRDRRLKRVADAWFRRDPQGARTAIDASALPATVKQTLLRHAPAPK